MSKKRVTTAALSLLLLAPFCAVGRATIRTVGPSTTSCPNAQYKTIAAAVSAAAPLDEIDICPGLYPEQLIITKPLSLVGVNVNGVNRALIQPALQDLNGLPSEAVITVMNTRGVTIQNLAIDASNNTVSGCNLSVSGIYFLDASGVVQNDAITGAQLTDPSSCTALFPGNGFGIQVTVDSQCGLCRLIPVQVSIANNSIHNFGRDGILAMGDGVDINIANNAISGAGPGSGSFQFGVFLANGAVGLVKGNVISQGPCGSLATLDCYNLRSEGVVLRAVGDGTVVDSNIISIVQSGIFVNGANRARITNNIIQHVEALSGIDIQGSASGYFTNSLIAGNQIFNVGPIDSDASNDEEGCGINEYSGTGVSGNILQNNTVSDAYCGIASVAADQVQSGTYFNTLYETLNSDMYPCAYPPATEPDIKVSSVAPDAEPARQPLWQHRQAAHQ